MAHLRTAPALPTADRTWTPARTVGVALGAVYVAVGIAGALVTGWSQVASMHGQTLLVFEVNPLHNVAHLGLGAALLVGALMGTEVAASTNRLVGGVFALLTVVGPFLMGTSMDPIAVNTWDHVLHAGTAAVLLAYPLVVRAVQRRKG